MAHSHRGVCCIVPPHILRRLADSPEYRDRALRTLAITEQLRGARDVAGVLPLPVVPGVKRRTIFDADHGTTLPGSKIRDEGLPPSPTDDAANEAYDYSGDTYDFFERVFGRNSID